MSDKPDNAASSSVGVVYLVGAGPGDAELISVKGLRLIRQADCIVYDALANPVLLTHARPDAELINAGKRAGTRALEQGQTNQTLAEQALAGRTVVRLKGGDPYLFGRGSEEALYLHERDIPFEVVPGVTAAVGSAAYAGIPITHRGVATTVTFITGHEDPTKDATQTDYAALARLAAGGGTLCFYMGLGRLGDIVGQLTRYGLDAATPAAVVQWGTWPRQRSVRATLGGLVAEVERAGLTAPAIIVIGQVVAVDPEGALCWFQRRPLFGQTVIVTRTRHQASALREQLEQLGARVLEAPTIAIEPPDDWAPIDEAIRQIGQYDWLVLTSANGVAGLRRRLMELDLDARHLAGVKIAAIGDATAEALRDMGLRADLVPTEFVAESLAHELIAQEQVRGRRFLLLRADIARPALIEKLTEAGADVTERSIYRTRPARCLPDEVLDALRNGQVDWITFTSSSTVRGFVDLLGEHRDLLNAVALASIGPITSQTVRELDLTVSVEAPRHDIAGLVDALVTVVSERK